MELHDKPTKDDYNKAMVETLFLISIPGMKYSIINASKEPIEK